MYKDTELGLCLYCNVNTDIFCPVLYFCFIFSTTHPKVHTNAQRTKNVCFS